MEIEKFIEYSNSEGLREEKIITKYYMHVLAWILFYVLVRDYKQLI